MIPRINLSVICVIIFILIESIDKTVSNKNDECENSVLVKGKKHKKVVWVENIDRPYQLAFYQHKEILFYSYNVGIEEEDTFKIAYLHKHSYEHHDLEIENGFATAVDDENHVVYFGGNLGIYKYHPDKNRTRAEKILSKYNVWTMFFRKKLYFIKYPIQRLYELDVHHNKSIPERVKHIHEKIYLYGIDGNHHQYITNDTGLYQIKNGSSERIRYHGEHVFRGMAVDKKGEIYFCGKHGIFVANHHNHTLQEILHVRNIFGLTFDNHNNIIYSNPYEIVTLYPCETTKKKN